MDMNLLMLSMFFGAVGCAMFTYGKKMGRMVPMGAGAALLVFPYFVSSLLLMFVVGSGLMALPWLLRE
jgi:hypothetical protein